MHGQVTRRTFLRWAGRSVATVAAGPTVLERLALAADFSRPNIVLIMADDMGFSDAGCFGGEIHTPNLDRLAANGLRFTQFYNCARCCPTRASLMTGQYAHKVGLALNGRDLTRNGITIAEGLRRAGYTTAMAGKWHLSRTAPLDDGKLHQKWLDHQYDPGKPFAPLQTYPVNRGFDKHYGVIWGVIDHFDPFSLVDGIEPVEAVGEDYYFADAVTEKAVGYVRDFERSDRPFFLYVAHCAPHWPLHARGEDIAKYKDAYKGGWEKLRRDRYRRMLEMGLFSEANTPLPPIQDRGRKWDGLSEAERAFQAAKMAVHAAMVDRIDQGIGKIVETLKQTGQFDNTVIFFLSDNGASPEVPQGPGYDRSSQTRDGREIQYRGIFDPGSQTTYTGIGPAWASASNTPFRYWKKESFEGGCHTPLVVHWPKGLGVEAGTVAEQAGHVIDILPTCLELAGASYPRQYQGHELTPLDGKSLAPVLSGKRRKGHASLYFEHEGGRAVRMGDWKLVALKGRPWRLYDLMEDRTEMNDLAAMHPDRVRAMSREWDRWAKEVGLSGP
ncbi:MAG: arylsulfatase [Phycisphaerales bacterium]|nr:MAG: arylsulfatase [Phycisphaerales bacterium]